MWKKEEENTKFTSSGISKSPVDQLKEKAVIGASIQIKGEVTGEEDLRVNGQVEGKIELKRHRVTVGKSGRVKADLYGKVISVEGMVQGNLFGEDKVIIRQSGTVQGNVTSPRVTLEDGAKFKGRIEMDSQAGVQQSLKETVTKASGELSKSRSGVALASGLKRNQQLSVGDQKPPSSKR